MKQTVLFIAIIGMCSLGSCSDDFLELYPETSVTSNTFYKTPAHFEQALMGAYARVRTLTANGMIMDEMRSDNAHFTRYSGDRGPYLTTEVIGLFLDDETTGNWINNRYNELYSGISRVNTALDRLDASQLTDAEKTKVRAEALFLRAFFYFDLATHWGPVPLMLHEVTNESESFLPNATVEAVYEQILADVSEAITLGLPAATSFPQSGRATMGAAKTLRAYACMSKPARDYAKAEQDLLDVTRMNYALEENYADIYSLGNKNGKESIFEIQYLDGDGGQHNDLTWRQIPKCSNNDLLMGIQANNYAYTSGGWSVPTQDMIDSYEEGDLRLSASVAVAEGTDVQEQFTFERLAEPRGYAAPEDKAFRYFVIKYYHPPYSYALRTGDNFPVYRYGGVLLLLAECLVEEGKQAEALPYLNAVRQRAGLPALTTANKQNVSDEMRHELAFENHRWTDLIRTGQAISVMNAFGARMKALDPQILPGAFQVTQERLVYAFQRRELEVNVNLVQNPGYKDY
ncbi:MAG: RagB/SusD family nutrient uptake outer membrane protein [Tannerella sp.]|nr:RagB/SusD family nutrient uptake outer membrane protein [Tannerella sp.]